MCPILDEFAEYTAALERHHSCKKVISTGYKYSPLSPLIYSYPYISWWKNIISLKRCSLETNIYFIL